MKFTVKRNKAVIAELTLTKLGRWEAEIEYLKIDPAYRGQKLGSDLLKRCIAHAAKYGLTLVAFPNPDGSGMTTEQIKSWLVRYGFKHDWYNFNRHFGEPNNKRVLILSPSVNITTTSESL